MLWVSVAGLGGVNVRTLRVCLLRARPNPCRIPGVLDGVRDTEDATPEHGPRTGVRRNSAA